MSDDLLDELLSDDDDFEFVPSGVVRDLRGDAVSPVERGSSGVDDYSVDEFDGGDSTVAVVDDSSYGGNGSEAVVDEDVVVKPVVGGFKFRPVSFGSSRSVSESSSNDIDVVSVGESIDVVAGESTVTGVSISGAVGDESIDDGSIVDEYVDSSMVDSTSVVGSFSVSDFAEDSEDVVESIDAEIDDEGFSVSDDFEDADGFDDDSDGFDDSDGYFEDEGFEGLSGDVSPISVSRSFVDYSGFDGDGFSDDNSDEAVEEVDDDVSSSGSVGVGYSVVDESLDDAVGDYTGVEVSENFVNDVSGVVDSFGSVDVADSSSVVGVVSSGSDEYVESGLVESFDDAFHNDLFSDEFEDDDVEIVVDEIVGAVGDDVVGSSVTSSTVDSSVVSTDDFLSELLSDEDDVSDFGDDVSSGSVDDELVGDDVSGYVSKASSFENFRNVVDVGVGSSDYGSSGLGDAAGVDSVSGEASVAFGRVVDSASVVDDGLSVSDRERLARARADDLVRREERRLAKLAGDGSKGSSKGKRKQLPVSSKYVRKPVREVDVDDEGWVVPVKGDVGSSVENGSVAVGEGSGAGSRYRYLSSDRRLNVAELEFFRNLGAGKSAVLDDDSLLSGLRGGDNESEADRKVRAKLLDRGVRGRDGLKRGSKSSFNEKDRETLQFLAMFRYATDGQLARMFSLSVRSSYNRLKKLRGMGLVIDRKIYGARPIWFLTDAGMLLSGFDLPRTTESRLTFSMFPHQFTVNNTAANLWGANVNVLNQSDFPSRNRVDVRGDKVFGESLVSELEIQSAFGKLKRADKADTFRSVLLPEMDMMFSRWERAGGVEFGPSPEQVLGNEHMWALLPPHNVRLAYHVPDLVVKRPRNADGSPESIAVEVEISNKPGEAYERTLKAYRADKRLYKKVIWVCKSRGPAQKLEQYAKELGLFQEGRIDIVPIITEDGAYKERDLWMI